jgi:hypothetical protein
LRAERDDPVKTFYTDRDIEDMHAAGVTEVEVHDDVVLTDLAREKALALGLRLKSVEKQDRQAERMLRALGTHLPPAKRASASSPTNSSLSPADGELVSRIKAAVIAKLGTSDYNDLLDQVIPQVLARLSRGSSDKS